MLFSVSWMTKSLPSRRVQRRQDLKSFNTKQLEIQKTTNVPNQEPSFRETKAKCARSITPECSQRWTHLYFFLLGRALPVTLREPSPSRTVWRKGHSDMLES